MSTSRKYSIKRKTKIVWDMGVKALYKKGDKGHSKHGLRKPDYTEFGRTLKQDVITKTTHILKGGEQEE